MEKINVAVIGCGTIANNSHIPSYLNNPKVNVKYFCDIIPERAEAAVAKYGCGTAVTDYHDVLADPAVVAVSVCTPNHMHARISIDAMEAGKHVLCEKPAARTYAEALEMQEAQKRTGKILNIGVVNRFNTGVNKLKALIDGGHLGDIYQVYVSFRSHRSIPGLGGDFTNKDIAGGGVLIDWGVHFLDIVMYCCGDPAAKTVSAETFSHLGKNIPGYTYVGMWAGPPKMDGVYSVEEGITGMVRTEGPVVTLNGAWAQNIEEREMFIDFIGTKAGARLQYGKEFTVYGTENGMLTKTMYTYSAPDMFQQEIDAFVRCIETGERLPSNIDTVIRTAELMDALYRSAEEHAEIKL